MNANLRQATADDMSAIVALAMQGLPEAWSDSLMRQTFDTAGYEYWLFEQHDAVVGYYLTLDVCDETHLMQVVVAEHCRDQGIGKLMLGHLIAQKRGRRILLEVRVSNSAAIGLYRAVGFQRDGVRAGYYKALVGQVAEDAMLMHLAA
ncbi:MAG: ribosomal protein S18-alanine N-acetyltransferase [Zetaproteobacteria bacterium]|nr:ribosomal protein S18-alanine N-acetyltransferase [Zetaproteobacteria bacterium]